MTKCIYSTKLKMIGFKMILLILLDSLLLFIMSGEIAGVLINLIGFILTLILFRNASYVIGYISSIYVLFRYTFVAIPILLFVFGGILNDFSMGKVSLLILFIGICTVFVILGIQGINNSQKLRQEKKMLKETLIKES